MPDNPNTYRMALALALTAVLIYFGIPALMGIPGIAELADRFVLHPAQPIVTGLALGAGIGIIAGIAYFFYSALKQLF